MNAYEIALDLERAEHEAISALKEWRRVARLIPADMEEREPLIHHLTIVIENLEGIGERV